MARRPQSLTGRPRHRAPAKDVQVEVADGLATIATLIYHDAISTVLKPKVARNLRGHGQEVPGQRRIRIIDLSNPSNVAHRDDQDVRRGLRGKVMKRDRIVVPVDHFGGDIAGSDPAEDAFGHNNSSLIGESRPGSSHPTVPNPLCNRDDRGGLTPQDTWAEGDRRCPNGPQCNSLFH